MEAAANADEGPPRRVSFAKTRFIFVKKRRKAALSTFCKFLELELTPSGLVVLQYNQIPVFLLAPPNFSIFSKSRQHGGNRPPPD